MNFFKLTHPPYRDDLEADRRNPVTSSAKHRIPGILCDLCGPWSSSHRLRVSLPDRAEEFAGVTFLPVTDWRNDRSRWATLLGVDISLVEPGAEVGPPSGSCSAEMTEDVVHPIPGEIWVGSRVHEALAGAGLSGVSFAAVELPPACGKARLVELVVHGRAWRAGYTEESLRQCETCHRRGFPSPRHLVVDEARWDGSDFLLLDGNPNIVVVSERVAEVIKLNDFSNIVAAAIG